MGEKPGGCCLRASARVSGGGKLDTEPKRAKAPRHHCPFSISLPPHPTRSELSMAAAHLHFRILAHMSPSTSHTQSHAGKWIPDNTVQITSVKYWTPLSLCFLISEMGMLLLSAGHNRHTNFIYYNNYLYTKKVLLLINLCQNLVTNGNFWPFPPTMAVPLRISTPNHSGRGRQIQSDLT